MSLFRRVTRYRVAPTQNPQENRLTEVTGAVLERVDGLASHVVEAVVATAATAANNRLFEAEGEANARRWQKELDALEKMYSRLRAFKRPRVRVSTQRITKSGKFVDLELRLGPQPFAAGHELLFWIEVKHGAGVHGSQLTDYVKDIRREEADDRLVLMLAPRQSISELEGVPETMPVVEWQAVADAVRRWSRRSKLGPVDRFLVNDYLDYLHEEGLMDAEVLTAEHAFVLSAQPEAAQAVAKLMELADAYVQERWGKRGTTAGGKKPAYGTGYWAHYPLAAAGEKPHKSWRSTTLEWSLVEDTFRDEPRNAWVFTAGATFWAARNSPASLAENAEWLAAARKDGFEYVQSYYWRLWRHLYPEELLARKTLDAQADALGKWTVDSFRLLAAKPPPH